VAGGDISAAAQAPPPLPPQQRSAGAGAENEGGSGWFSGHFVLRKGCRGLVVTAGASGSPAASAELRCSAPSQGDSG